MVRKLTKEEFEERAREVHGEKYDYSKVEYKNTRTKVVITCPLHGDFKQLPINHLKGNGCYWCAYGSKEENEKRFKEKARNVHGNRYDYSNVNYINSYTKVEIICPKHGCFHQAPADHINKQYGCPSCFLENSTYYDQKWLDNNPHRHDEPCLIYLIKMYGNEETFLKLGVTQKDLAVRYSDRKATGYYEYEVIHEKLTILKEAVLLEQQVRIAFDGYRYSPLNRFGGWTECFTLEACSGIMELLN